MRRVRRLVPVVTVAEWERYNRDRHCYEPVASLPLPAITETGDLLQGLHLASLEEVLSHFGEGSVQRKRDGTRRGIVEVQEA
jgi:hypothetical protein